MPCTPEHLIYYFSTTGIFTVNYIDYSQFNLHSQVMFSATEDFVSN